MTIVNGKITEASEDELFDYYLSRDYDELYSFDDFCEKLKAAGLIITDKREGRGL